MKTDLLHLGVVLLLVLCCTTHAQVRSPAIPSPPPAADVPSEFLDIRPDGGYRFGYNTGDFGQHQHAAEGTPDGRVAGRYSERGRQTIYTAGPRGFRARGTHIARRMDLSQTRIPYNPPVNPDSPAYNPTYSGYHDPNEDPSYSFGFRTPTYNRQENSNSNAEVTGQYSYIDDVGERHQVDYIAGARTGFHVKTPYPDSIPLTGSLFVRAPGKPGQKARGRTAIQRGLDGSYRFTAAGPDQRRVEVSDSTGHVRGSYTYLDDKGVQRTTEYIAGPNIGYKVINSKKGPIYPYLPSGFTSPLSPGKDILNLNKPVDDLFDLPEGLNTAESEAAFKPPKKGKPGSDESLEDISSSSESGSGSQISSGKKPSKDSTSSASGGDDDFLLSLDDSAGSYGKPTSDYGTSDSSSSSGSPGNLLESTGNGHAGGGHTIAQDKDGQIFGKPAGFNNIQQVSGDGALNTNANDDIFGLSPVFPGSGDNINGRPLGGGLLKPTTDSSLFGGPEKPVGSSLTQLDSDIFGGPQSIPQRPSPFLSQTNDTNALRPSDSDKFGQFQGGQADAFDLSKPNSDDLFGSLSLDSGAFGNQQAGQLKPADNSNKPNVDDLFGTYPGTSGEIVEHQVGQGKPIGDLTITNHDDVFSSPGSSTYGDTVGTPGKPFNGITRPVSDDVFGLTPVGSGILGSHQEGQGKPSSSLTKPGTEDLFGLNPPGNVNFESHQGIQVKPSVDYSTDNLFGPLTLSDGTKGHEQTNKPRPIDNLNAPSSDDLFGSFSPNNVLLASQQGIQGKPPPSDYNTPNTDDLFGSHYPENGFVQPGTQGKPLDDFNKPNTDDLFGSYSPGNGAIQQGSQGNPNDDFTKPNTDDVLGSYSPGNGVIQQGIQGNPFGDFSKPSTDDLFGSYSPGSGVVQESTPGKPINDLTKPNTDDLFGSFSPGNGVVQHGTQSKPIGDFTKPSTDDLFAPYSPGNTVIQEDTQGKPFDDFNKPSTDDLFQSYSPGSGVVEQGTPGKPNTDDLFGSFISGNGVVQHGTLGKPLDDFTKPNTDDLFGSYSPGSGIDQQSTPGKPINDLTNPNTDDLFGSFSPGNGVVQHGTLGKPLDDFTKPNSDDLFGSYSPGNGVVQQGTPGKPVNDLTKPNTDDLFGSYSPGNIVIEQGTPGKPVNDLTKPTTDDLFGSFSPGNGVIQHGSLGKPVDDFTEPNTDGLFGSYSPGTGVVQQGTPGKPVNDLASHNTDDLFESYSPVNGVLQPDTQGKPIYDFSKPNTDDLFESYSPGNGVVQQSIRGKPFGDFIKPNTDDLFGSYSPGNFVLHPGNQGKPLGDFSKPNTDNLFGSISPIDGEIQQGTQRKPLDYFTELSTDDLLGPSLDNGTLQKGTQGKPPVEFTKPSSEDLFESYSPSNGAIQQGTQRKPLDNFTKLSTDDHFEPSPGNGGLQKGIQGKPPIEFTKPSPESLFGSSPGNGALTQGTEGKPQRNFIETTVGNLSGPASGKGAYQQENSPGDHIKPDAGYAFQLQSAGKAKFGNNLAAVRKPPDDLTETHTKGSPGTFITSNMFGSHLSVHGEGPVPTPKPNSSSLLELGLSDKRLPYDGSFSNHPDVFGKLQGIGSNDSFEIPAGNVLLSEYGSSNYSISDRDLFTIHPIRFDGSNEGAYEKLIRSDSLGRPKLKTGNEFVKGTFRESFEEPQHIDKGIMRGNNEFEYDWNTQKAVYRVRPGSDYFVTSPLHGSKTSGSYKPLDTDLFSDPVIPEEMYDNRTDVELLATAISFGKFHEGYGNFSDSDLFSSYEETFGEIDNERTKTVNGSSLPMTPQKGPISAGNIDKLSSVIGLNTHGQIASDNSKSISNHSADNNRGSQSNISGVSEKYADATLHGIRTENNGKSGTLLGSIHSNNLDNLPVRRNLSDISDRISGSGHSVAHAPASVDTLSTKYEDRLETDALSQKPFENYESVPSESSVGSQSVNLREVSTSSRNDDKSSSVNDPSNNVHTFDSSVENSQSPQAGVNPIRFPDNYFSGKPKDNFGLPTVVLLNRLTLKNNYRNSGPTADSVSLVKASEMSVNPQREYFGTAKRSDHFGISDDSSKNPIQSQSQLPRVYSLKTPPVRSLEPVHDLKFPHSRTLERSPEKKWNSGGVVERPTDFNYSKAYDEILFNRDPNYKKPALISPPGVSEVESAEDYGRPPDGDSLELKPYASRELPEYSEPTGYEKIRTSEEIYNEGSDKSWRTIVSSKIYSDLPKHLYHEEFNSSLRKPDEHFSVVPFKDEYNRSNNDERILGGLLKAEGKHIYLEEDHYPPETSDRYHKTSGNLLKVPEGHSADMLPKYPGSELHGVSSESSLLKAAPEQDLDNRKPADYGASVDIKYSDQNRDNINSNPLYRNAMKSLSEPEYRHPGKTPESYILENKDQNNPTDVNSHHQNQRDMLDRYNTNQQRSDYIGKPPVNLEDLKNGRKEPIVAILNLEETPRVYFVEPVGRDGAETILEDPQAQYKPVNRPLPSIIIQTPTSKWHNITIGDDRLRHSLENLEKTRMEDGSYRATTDPPGREQLKDSSTNYSTKKMNIELPASGNRDEELFSSDRLSTGPGPIKSVNGHGRPPERDLFDSGPMAPDEPTNPKDKPSELALLRRPTNLFVEGGSTVDKINNAEFHGHQEVFENVGYIRDKGSRIPLDNLERPRDGYDKLLNSNLHNRENFITARGENSRVPSQNNAQEHLAKIGENYSTSTDNALYKNLNQMASDLPDMNSDSYTLRSRYMDSPNDTSLERYPDMLRRQNLTNSSLDENRLSMSQKQGSGIVSHPNNRELLEISREVMIDSELDNSKPPTREINEIPQIKTEDVYFNNSDSKLLIIPPQETEKLESTYDISESYERSFKVSENSGGGHRDSPNRKVLAYPTHAIERPGTDFNRSTPSVLESPGRVFNTLPERGVLMRSTEETKFRDNERDQFTPGELFGRPVAEKGISEDIYSKSGLHYFQYKPEILETPEISRIKSTYSDILGRPPAALGIPENINRKLVGSDLFVRPAEFSQKSGNDYSKVSNIDIVGSSPEVSRKSGSNYINPVENLYQSEVLESGTNRTKDFKSGSERDFTKPPDIDRDLVDVSRIPVKIKPPSDEFLRDGAEDFKIQDSHYKRPESYLLERHPESISRPVLNYNIDLIERTEELISKSGIGYNRTSDSDLFINSNRDSGGSEFTHNRYSSPELFQSSDQVLGRHGISLSKLVNFTNRSDSVDSDLFGITTGVNNAGTDYSKNSDSDLYRPYLEGLDRSNGEYNRTSDVDLFGSPPGFLEIPKNGYMNFSNNGVFENTLSVSESIHNKPDGIIKGDVRSGGVRRNESSDTDIFESHQDVSLRPESDYRKQPDGSVFKSLPEITKHPVDYYKEPSDDELFRRDPDVSERLKGDYNSETDRELFGVLPKGGRNPGVFNKENYNSDVLESHPEVSKNPGGDFKKSESDLFGELSETTQRLKDSRQEQYDSDLVRRRSEDSRWVQGYYHEPFVRDFYGRPKEIYGRPGIGSSKYSHSNSFRLHPQYSRESVDDFRRHSSGGSYGNLPGYIQKPFNSEMFRSPLKVLGSPVNEDHKHSYEDLFVRQPDIFERPRLNYKDINDKILRRPYEDIETSKTMYKGVSGRIEKDYLFSRPLGHLGRLKEDYNTNDVFGSHPDVSRRSESDHIRSSDSDLYRDSLRASERPSSGYLKFSDSDLTRRYKGSLRKPESDYNKPYERGSFVNSRDFFERSERGNVEPPDIEFFENPEVFERRDF